MLAIAEMYVKGVSTRDVADILDKFGIDGLSSSQVSRASKLLDHGLEQWRNRALGEVRYQASQSDRRRRLDLTPAHSTQAQSSGEGTISLAMTYRRRNRAGTFRIEGGKISPIRSGGGVPSLNGRERRSSGNLLSPIRRYR